MTKQGGAFDADTIAASIAAGYAKQQRDADLVIEGDIVISASIDAPAEVLCVKYTPDYGLLAAGLTNGNIHLYNLASGKIIRTLKGQKSEKTKEPPPVTCIKHRPAQKNTPIPTTFIASYVDGRVKCWEYASGACLYTIEEGRQTLGVSYHNQLPKFITVGDDTRVLLYDEETKTQERSYQASDAPEGMDGHMSRVFAACFNPKSPHEFVTGGWDDTVQFWDVRQQYSVRHLYGVHMCGDGLDISRSGKEILSSSWQKKHPLQLWDYATAELIQNITPDIHDSMGDPVSSSRQSKGRS